MAMPQEIQQKIEEFFSQFPLAKFPKGEVIIQAEDDPKHITYLVEGSVQQYDISGHGDKIVVNVFKPPAFFPMSWAINKTPNQYFFEAASDVTARLAPPEEVVAFTKAEPAVMFNLLQRVYSGVDGLLRRTAHLMGGSAKSRLMFELIIEAKRSGQKNNENIHLPIKESQLGERAGLSRETVSRAINDLKKRDLITVDHQGVTVKNLRLLEQALGPDL